MQTKLQRELAKEQEGRQVYKRTRGLDPQRPQERDGPYVVVRDVLEAYRDTYEDEHNT